MRITIKLARGLVRVVKFTRDPSDRDFNIPGQQDRAEATELDQELEVTGPAPIEAQAYTQVVDKEQLAHISAEVRQCDPLEAQDEGSGSALSRPRLHDETAHVRHGIVRTRIPPLTSQTLE